MRFNKYDFIVRMGGGRPYDAPLDNPQHTEGQGHEMVYFFSDLLDQFILLPITLHWTSCYVIASVVHHVAVQLNLYTDLIDATVDPLMIEFNRILGFHVTPSPYPSWLQVNPLAVDLHNRCGSIYHYRVYPTYELGKMVAENWSLHWHLTFNPAKIGTLGMNMAEPRYVHAPIACLGADFNIGPVKGAFHFGWKFNGNGFLIDSISMQGIRFCDPASSPRLGFWLTFEFYEYNSAPPSRSQVQNLLRIN